MPHYYGIGTLFTIPCNTTGKRDIWNIPEYFNENIDSFLDVAWGYIHS